MKTIAIPSQNFFTIQPAVLMESAFTEAIKQSQFMQIDFQHY